MIKHPADSAAEYTRATSMQAIGMTQSSETGRVTDALKTLSVPVPRPASCEVANQIAACAIRSVVADASALADEIQRAVNGMIALGAQGVASLRVRNRIAV